MRFSQIGFLGLALLTGCSPPPDAGPKGEDYLTKDGNLVAKLVVTDGSSGIVGVSGRRFRVEPSGNWTIATVKDGKETVKQTGALSKEGLADLARELTRYNLRSLESITRPEGPTPHVISIAFGDRAVGLTMLTGASVPAPDPSTLEGRFGGIVRAVTAALEPPGAKSP